MKLLFIKEIGATHMRSVGTPQHNEHDIYHVSNFALIAHRILFTEGLNTLLQLSGLTAKLCTIALGKRRSLRNFHCFAEFIIKFARFDIYYRFPRHSLICRSATPHSNAQR